MKRTGKSVSSGGGSAGFAVAAISLYARELRRFLGRRIRRRWDVDDLAQEVYLRLLKTDPDGVRRPLEFMLGVAQHVLMDRFRAASREEQTFPAAADAVELLQNEPSEALEDRLEECLTVHQELSSTLAQLSPAHAAALVLFHRDGLTYQEIGRKLGITLETVHTYIRDARRQIRMKHWAQRAGTGDE